MAAPAAMAPKTAATPARPAGRTTRPAALLEDDDDVVDDASASLTVDGILPETTHEPHLDESADEAAALADDVEVDALAEIADALVKIASIQSVQYAELGTLFKVDTNEVDPSSSKVVTSVTVMFVPVAVWMLVKISVIQRVELLEASRQIMSLIPLY